MKSKSTYISFFWPWLCVLIMLGVFMSDLHAQEVANKKENKEIEGANAVREEIQRYMGYEPLMPRYLTLPYDATTNSNVQDAFVDIGYLFMSLIPILFLFGFRKKPWIGLLSMLLFLGLLYVSIGSGKFFTQGNFMPTTEFAHLEPNNGVSIFPSDLVSPVYRAIGKSYQGVNNFFHRNSGKSDAFTYPILFLLFGLITLLIQQRAVQLKNTKRIFILFVTFFSFMWILLTAGIIWYGYPMIALSILLILSSLSPKKKEEGAIWSIYFKRILGLLSIGIFVLLSMVYRLSNYQFKQNKAMAKTMFDTGELKYQSGRQNKRQVLSGFFDGGINEAIKKVNQEEKSLVYAVGTVLPYHVRKNDKRVFLDNQLQNFERLRNHYKDKNTLVEVLKANEFRYIFVDLMTYSIDKTPEKTLTSKYKEFMRVLYQNPKVKLMATNRRINASDDPQKPRPEYGVFAAPLPGYHGTYAIFELID